MGDFEQHASYTTDGKEYTNEGFGLHHEERGEVGWRRAGDRVQGTIRRQRIHDDAEVDPLGRRQDPERGADFQERYGRRQTETGLR